MKTLSPKYISSQDPAWTGLFVDFISRYKFIRKRVRKKITVDVSCGAGFGADTLAKNPPQYVIGLDLRFTPLAKARNAFPTPTLNFFQASSRQTPLRDGGAEAVVAFEVFAETGDPEALAAELRRIIAPGGEAFVSLPNPKMAGGDADRLEIALAAIEKYFEIAERYRQVIDDGKYEANAEKKMGAFNALAEKYDAAMDGGGWKADWQAFKWKILVMLNGWAIRAFCLPKGDISLEADKVAFTDENPEAGKNLLLVLKPR